MPVVDIFPKWIRAVSSYSFIINVGITFLLVFLTYLNIYLKFYYEKDELQMIFADLNVFIASEYGPYPEIENDAMSPHLVIINPYGSIYPETDIENLAVMRLTLWFMNNGGVFVNVADIPFFFPYDL